MYETKYFCFVMCLVNIGYSKRLLCINKLCLRYCWFIYYCKKFVPSLSSTLNALLVPTDSNTSEIDEFSNKTYSTLTNASTSTIALPSSTLYSHTKERRTIEWSTEVSYFTYTYQTYLYLIVYTHYIISTNVPSYSII